MKNQSPICPLWHTATAIALLGASSPAFAQSMTTTYTLEDVWMVRDSEPAGRATQMTGTFVWTYDAGDFENGSGEFTEVHIPGFWSDLSDLIVTIETGSIEFSLLGNWHDRGVDISIFLDEPLDPVMPSPVDLVRSKWAIEFGTVTRGHFIDGWIVPQTCQPDLTGDGVVDSGDLSAFITLFLAGDPAVDFTGDGVVDSGDLSLFIQLFLAGC